MGAIADLIEAVKRGDADAVAALLAEDAALARQSDELGKTALHWAAESDRVDAARLLLDAGADIEARTTWGASPLDWAAGMGSPRVAELLLSRGASGMTLIHAAALGKRGEVEAIVESGADLTAHRRRGAPAAPDEYWPPDTAHITGDVLSDALHAAARNGHVEVAEYLLSRGAAIDAKGFFGATGLHWAAINGHADMVRWLVAHGADTALTDARFHATPAEWAAEGGHHDLVPILGG